MAPPDPTGRTPSPQCPPILPRQTGLGYHERVLFRLGRRAVFSAVTFFALLGFVSVPLGEKTGWAHLQAIAATPAASEAIEDFKDGVGLWQHRLVGWLTAHLHSQGESEARPAESAAAGPSDFSVPSSPNRTSKQGSPPIARPPHLSQ
jgi:hypothetical protein